MKKVLLILVLCLLASVSKVNAQTVTQIYPIQACVDINTGLAYYALDSQLTWLLDGLDPQIHVVTYYTSLTDAENGTNVIANPNGYSSLGETIFARVENTVNNTYLLFSFQLIVLLPSNITATLVFCDPSELPIYNLMDAHAQFDIDPQSINSIAYFLTLTDAQNYTNPLPNPGYAAQNNQGTETVYIRYVNFNGCESIGTIILESNICSAACPAPINFTTTQLSDILFAVSWSSPLNTFQSYVYMIGNESSFPNGNPIIITGEPSTSVVINNLSANECRYLYVKNSCSQSQSQWVGPISICATSCSNSGQCGEALVLNAFLDSNNNGIKDDGEVNFPYGTFTYQINDSGTTLNGYTNTGSYYLFDNNATNSYDLSLAINSDFSSYYSCTTTYSNVTLPTGSGVNNLYFPVTITNPHIDASVSIYSNQQPRAGFTYSNTLVYKNNSALPIASGTVTFTKDADVTIAYISQAGTTPTADGFSYNFFNLQPFETRYIYVEMQVPPIPTVQLGDLLTNSVNISVDNDVDLTNNEASITQTVVGSYDPNDKMESHGRQIVFDDFTANDYLTYTIRFENTGTANADFIRIEDALDSQLDENTFELLSASHDVNVRRDGTALTFHFFAIDLPPSSININDGHGYVQFKIKPKAGYAIGDIIPNTASIYFDYNPPIVTNTFETEFVQSLKTSNFTQENVVIYPNPATSHVQVALNNSTENIGSITLVDFLGKTILEQTFVNNTQATINTSLLAKGMYLIKITSNTNDSVVKKLIIQ